MKENDNDAEQVSANEDLMREHGVLKRVLLVYGEGVRRLQTKQDISADVLHGAADMIRRFIEEYHEKLEEDHLFPRFEKAGQLVDLVKMLRLQHERGRERTANVLRLATAAGLKNESDRQQLIADLTAFIRMYEPHEAREDTVLFPAFKKLVSPHEYDALGEQFEKEEHTRFGGDGFDMAVDQVTNLEKAIGIYDLSQFTPAP